MGRGANKYTDEQRDAIVRLIVDDGKTAQAAVDLAAAGKLPDLDPFEMPEPTARHLAGRARRRAVSTELAELDAEHPGAAEEIRTRFLAILSREVDEIEEQQDAGELDLERVRQVLRALHELQRTFRDLRATQPPQAKTADAPESELMERLVTQHRASNGSPSPAA